ncbi:hypothetical protein SLEP1_g31471 [Rubroshorea leprosula]|uniref:Uncharacterized protein n=1 Tax=Rubroshorea leprosula TaxID=152421 RepID=A0AAV5KAH1_9ROSI|nr:hypothetical protein SLEP1_g31471 [Rubroshorea leprosula]
MSTGSREVGDPFPIPVPVSHGDGDPLEDFLWRAHFAPRPRSPQGMAIPAGIPIPHGERTKHQEIAEYETTTPKAEILEKGRSRSEGGIPRSEKMEKGGSGWEKNQVMTGDVGGSY